MRKFTFFLCFIFQSFFVFGQSLTFFDSYLLPISDTSKVDPSYLRIEFIENGVFHDQLYTLDSVKVSHLIALLDENNAKKSQQLTYYYPDGEVSSKTKMDFEQDIKVEMHYYPNGKLKHSATFNSGKLEAEKYFSQNGEEI
ncbi:toxin-antitoxin system YwqK family antitoxin [Algoriphagus hitonicola]|nr:hypothetical protein [Algoriphagus hitonicola]